MNFQNCSKDIKKLIGNFLDDKDIFNYSVINKDQYSYICNEGFFHNILLYRYPDTLKYRNTNFKKWFLSVINYVDWLKQIYGFDYRKYNQGDPKEQFNIFGKLKDKENRNQLLILASERKELPLIK